MSTKLVEQNFTSLITLCFIGVCENELSIKKV